jgi:translocation and assembly module TamB
LRILREHKPLVDIRMLRGGVDLSNGGLQADKLVADTDLGRFSADGRYQPHRDYRTDLTATAVFPPRSATCRRGWGWWHAASCRR